MADWNPSLYLQFDAERTRPAADLLSRIAHLPVKHAVDLGCGPGNSTRLLRAAWPLATIVGIDNSPAMLTQAAQALPDCEFIDADIARWQPAQPVDVIYANASLQWLRDHETLFPHLVKQLAANGTLAVQMPDNWQEPLPHPDAAGCQRDGVAGPRAPAVTPARRLVRSAEPPWL